MCIWKAIYQAPSKSSANRISNAVERRHNVFQPSENTFRVHWYTGRIYPQRTSLNFTHLLEWCVQEVKRPSCFLLFTYNIFRHGRKGKLGRGEGRMRRLREAAMDLCLRRVASVSGAHQSGMDALPDWAASIS